MAETLLSAFLSPGIEESDRFAYFLFFLSGYNKLLEVYLRPLVKHEGLT